MKRVFIIVHKTLLEGPMDYFEAYLERKAYTVLKLEHPLDTYTNRQSFFYADDKTKKIICQRRNLSILNLILDFYLSLKYLLQNSFDVCIGANNFDTFAAVVCRKFFFKKIKEIIYFASDFSESRFNNSILDTLYYAIEGFVLRNADLVISNTKRAEEKRITLGLAVKKSIVIPNGVYLKKPQFTPKKIDKQTFIYVGTVTKEHGLYEMIEAISPMIKKLVIIGQGDDWERVIALCKTKKFSLETHYKKDHEFVISYLQQFSGIGLAPYNLFAKWTYYCSPLKVNEYIACGVPVIISSVPEIAEEIKKKQLGILYQTLDAKQIRQEIIHFDTNQFYRKAERFYHLYNYDNLYDKISICS